MKKRVIKPLLFAAPALLIYTVFWIAPMLVSLIMSFYETSGFAQPWKFVGLGNYRLMLSDPLFFISLTNNLKWMGMAVLFPIALGLGFALLLNTKFKLQVLFRGIFYYPSILAMVSVGLIWSWIFNPSGLLVSFQKLIGAKPVIMLGSTSTALYGDFIAGTWAGVGTCMVMFLAGLQTIPSETYEVASIEGANFLQKFWYVTLPMLRQTFVIVISLALINSMKVFDIIMVTTRGGPGTSTYMLAIYMYINSFKSLYMGLGAAISWAMVIMVAVPVIPYILVMQKADE